MGLTCREAILRTLERAGKPLTASEIAAAINAGGLYARGDGRPLPPYQVYAAAYQGDDLFEVERGFVRLAHDPREPSAPASERKDRRLIIAVAGAHFVAGELSRLGWLVALTCKGAASVDALARLHPGGSTLALKVKSRTCAYQYAWRVGPPADPDDCDFYAFVDLQDQGKRPLFFIVPTSHVARLCVSQHVRTEDLRAYAENWEALYLAVEGAPHRP